MDIQIGDIIMDKSDDIYYIVKGITVQSFSGAKDKTFIQFGDVDDPHKYTYSLSEKAINREFQKIC